MDQLIARIVGTTGLDAEVVRKAVGLILAYLAKEGPEAEVAQLLAGMPGAPEAVAAAENGGSGGLAGGLMGMLGGAGGIMALGSKLMAAGVPMDQMQSLGHEVLAFGRETAGDDVVADIVAKTPGLSQFG
jgi:hypothetical protein